MVAQKPARRVPAGTFTQPKEVIQQQGRDKSDPNWDWKNPFDNPSGAKPVGEKPHKPYKGIWRRENYPILTTDGDGPTYLFDPELVTHLRENEYGKKVWDKMPEIEQIRAQVDWVTDPRNPLFGKDVDTSIRTYDKYVKERAAYLQDGIARVDPDAVEKFVHELRMMAEDADTLGPMDFIDNLKLTDDEREAVIEYLFNCRR